MSIFSMFENLVDPYQPYKRQTPPANVWDFLKENLRPFYRIMAVSVVFAVIAAGIEVWLIGYLGVLIDRLVTTEPEQIWVEHGNTLIAVALFILVVRPLAPLIREGLDDITFFPNATALVQWRAHRHVMQQSVGWFQNDMAGRIAAHVQVIGRAATGATYQVLHTFSFVAVYVVGSVWLMASVDVWLMFPLIIWVGLYAGLMAYAVPRMEKASAEHQEGLSSKTGMIVDNYSNIETVKLFGTENQQDDETYQRFEDVRQAFLKVQKIEVLINVGMVFLNSVLIVGLVGGALILWREGEAQIGIIATAFALSFRINDMANWFMDAMSSLFSATGGLRETLKTVAQPLAITDASDAQELLVSGGEILLEGISHHYGKGAGGLDDISLQIAAGEKVGIIGRSGAGKSTLVNLILRFFELEGGQIAIDGQDISAVTQDSLRRNIGMVTQENTLLHRSVRDNIAYGAVKDQAAVEAAAGKAEAHEFILELQDQKERSGYDAFVGDRGVKLSGGQRQRIAIARVILKNAPILALDEATSALDSEVEAAIQSTFDSLMEGKTVIAIAHRLSTIAQMDRIIVLDGGRIIEQGSHDELLMAGGQYAKFWNRQSGGFIGLEAAE